jgi:hypothetical protein
LESLQEWLGCIKNSRSRRRAKTLVSGVIVFALCFCFSVFRRAILRWLHRLVEEPVPWLVGHADELLYDDASSDGAAAFEHVRLVPMVSVYNPVASIEPR